MLHQQLQGHGFFCPILLSASTRPANWNVRSRSISIPQQACRWQTSHPALQRRDRHAMAASKSATAAAGPASAKDAVEQGLQAFHERRDAASALSLFERALELSPTEEEARAAMYNSACAHAKLKQWKQAADAAVLAINKYGEPLSTAIKVGVLPHKPGLLHITQVAPTPPAAFAVAGRLVAPDITLALAGSRP